MGGRRHLAPCLAQDGDHLRPLGFLRQIAQLILERDEAERIFQHLHLRIAPERFFQIQLANAGDCLRVEAGAREDRHRLRRVEALQVAAPAQVAGATGLVVRARAHPAPQMLAARGQPQRFGGERAKSQDPLAQPLRVKEFTGQRLVLPLDGIGILRILRIEVLPRHEVARGERTRGGGRRGEEKSQGEIISSSGSIDVALIALLRFQLASRNPRRPLRSGRRAFRDHACSAASTSLAMRLPSPQT